jgi:hypothetical protein
METVSEVIGYDFDDSDWLAVSTALGRTDDERSDGWYVHPLVGDQQVDMRLAQAVGGDEVSVNIGDTAPEHLREKIALLLSVFARYRVVADMESGAPAP